MTRPHARHRHRPAPPPRLRRARRAAVAVPAIALALDGALGDPSRLCARAVELLEASGAGLLICDADGVAADLAALDAIARLALTARRRGSRLSLRGTSAELTALIALAGLTETLLG